MNELGSLITDIGFPIVAALLMFYLVRQVLKQLADAEKARMDAEKIREANDAKREERDDNERKAFMQMIIEGQAQSAKSIEKMGDVASSVQQLANAVLKSISESSEDREAAAISRQSIHASIREQNEKLGEIGGKVAENFTLINGVGTTMIEICTRLETLQSTVEDAEISKKIESLQGQMTDLQKAWKTKKKTTDETPAAPAPAADEAENSL